MRLSEAFPSKYFSATDLDGENLAVVISQIEMEDFEDNKTGKKSRKPVLYFQHHKKGLALNVTNARKIADVYGDEMDDWVGREIILFPAMVDSFGETKEAIRVRAPQPKDRPQHRSPARQDPITTSPRRMADTNVAGNEPPPWEPDNR